MVIFLDFLGRFVSISSKVKCLFHGLYKHSEMPHIQVCSNEHLKEREW